MSSPDESLWWPVPASIAAGAGAVAAVMWLGATTPGADWFSAVFSGLVFFGSAEFFLVSIIACMVGMVRARHLRSGRRGLLAAVALLCAGVILCLSGWHSGGTGAHMFQDLSGVVLLMGLAGIAVGTFGTLARGHG